MEYRLLIPITIPHVIIIRIILRVTLVPLLPASTITPMTVMLDPIHQQHLQDIVALIMDLQESHVVEVKREVIKLDKVYLHLLYKNLKRKHKVRQKV